MQVERLMDHIVAWLDGYCQESGLKGFIVGVSGGIDSAVTSVLCAKTGKPTTVVSMPILQATDQVERTSRHIAWLENKFINVKSIDLDLTAIFNAFKGVIPDNAENDLAMANSRSRIRMTLLYALASNSNVLVVGTGNRIEDFGIGFYTKYGDGGVDVSPIAELMKSQVYAMGKAMGIDDAIIEAAPTDGLWNDNRCDENQIGATYDELEWAMNFLCTAETDEKYDKLGSRSKEVLSIYKNLRNKNLHKMLPIPVCPIPKKLLLF